MNLKLVRKKFLIEGIFGELFDENGLRIAVTLEHSYGNLPKLPAGTYVCRRGQHRLESMHHSFETFEILNVPGHTDILFHCGNWQSDSQGCVLLGTEIAPLRITESAKAFDAFMKLQAGLDTFALLVEDDPGAA